MDIAVQAVCEHVGRSVGVHGCQVWKDLCNFTKETDGLYV